MNKGEFGGLIYELPDFIEGKISDEIIRNKIISLIKEDENFRMEYESLKNSIGSIRSTKINSPGNEYFANLTLKINKRIDEKIYPAGVLEKLKGLFINWKFATVFSVLLITVIFYKSGLIKNEGGNYLNEKISEFTVHNNPNISVDSTKNIVDEEDYEFVDFDDENNSSSIKIKNKTLKDKNKINKKDNNPDFSLDEFGDTQLYCNADDISIEDEFVKMTPKQQKEFLKNLENLKL